LRGEVEERRGSTGLKEEEDSSAEDRRRFTGFRGEEDSSAAEEVEKKKIFQEESGSCISKVMGCRERRIYWLQGKWNEKVNRLQGEIGSEEERRFFGSKGMSKKEKDSPAAEEDQEKWFTTRFEASEFFWKETFHLFQGRWRNDLAIYTQEVEERKRFTGRRGRSRKMIYYPF
jgi:hypothetical protein